MGGAYSPTFGLSVLLLVPGVVAVALIPVVWIVYILGLLLILLFNPSNVKSAADQGFEYVFLATIAPIAATMIHMFVIIWTICMLPFGLFYAGKDIVASIFRLFTHYTRKKDRRQKRKQPVPVEPQSRALQASTGSTGQSEVFTGPYRLLQSSDHFRLLGISPGKYDWPLSGKLITANISDIFRPSYEALSYTWADESNDGESTQSILCDTEHGVSVIMITKNCDAAIRRLRRSDKMRWMWIDAICINQNDDAERTHQVAMMSRIYVLSSGVVVYTGEETTETNLLFDWVNGLEAKDLKFPSRWDLEHVAGSVATGLWVYWDVAKENLLGFVKPRKRRVEISEQKLTEIAKGYFARRWFNRVWVLQEVTLRDIRDTTVICGSKSTTGVRALHLLSLLYKESSGTMIRIFVLLRQNVKGKKSHLLDILVETRHRQCADPRDKIFGILSIAKYIDGNKFPEIEANYEMTIQETYAHYSSFFIQQHGIGFFLSLIKSRSKMAGLPSWAADWTLAWPNYNILRGRDFAAASRGVGSKDYGVEFRKGVGYHILTLTRPTIIQGYFARTGHFDDENETFIESVEFLLEGEVLVQIYPGLALLLAKEKDYFVFLQVCPHALSVADVKDLVARWGSVVLDGEGWNGWQDTGDGYLGSDEIFNIR